MKKEKEVNLLKTVKGWELIPQRMKEQRKGLMRMTVLTDLSTSAISAIRDGRNGTLRTLFTLCEELGLELVIQPKKGVTPEVIQSHQLKTKTIFDIKQERVQRKKENEKDNNK